MTKRDYYEILGVAKDAAAGDIRKSYRQAALKYHPDHNPGDKDAEEKFKEAAEAYEVLSDSEKRATYDRFGHDGLSRQGFSGFSGFDDVFSHLGDIFGDIFGFSRGGGGGRRGGPSRGRDLGIEVALGFEEAVFGCKKALEVPREQSCETCGGSGARPGASPVTCNACGGRGEVIHSQGLLMIRTTCPQCRGQGRIIRDACGACRGAGQTRVVRNVEVNVPAGVDTGSRIRKRGEGLPGSHGGPPGDLIVVLHVAEHETFKRDDVDIHAEVPIDFATAALGGSVKVRTIHGDEKLHIDAGTQPGDVLKIRGKGVAKLNGHGQGDHYAHIRLWVPKKLSRKQRKLLEEFAATGDEHKGGTE